MRKLPKRLVPARKKPEYELDLSLITAGSLKKIAESFKSTKHKTFPHNLLLRDVLIQEERVLKAIERSRRIER